MTQARGTGRLNKPPIDLESREEEEEEEEEGEEEGKEHGGEIFKTISLLSIDPSIPGHEGAAALETGR